MATEYAPFCEKQAAYLRRCYSNWLNVAEGGKRAGKNVINILAWCDIIETHPDRLHLAAGVSVASAKLNIIDSNGFGVLNWFHGRCRSGKYQERDALYVQTATGEKIILVSGGGKEGDEKYIKGNTYGSAYCTEANECAASFIKEVFDRTLSSGHRWIGIDLNPKAPNHWFYADILDFHMEQAAHFNDYGLNYEHFTLHDNLSFSDDKIREIIRTYPKNTVWYIRDILGRRSNAEGVIYDMFGPANQYTDGQGGPNYDLWYTRYFTVDYGTTNPFACLEIIEQTIEQKTRYYVVNEYYYDSSKHMKQKEDSEYIEDLLKFIDGRRYTTCLIDPSAASFKIAARNKQIKVRDADNEVLDGIRLVASLLRTGKLLVNKTKCPNLCNEFLSYIWDAKASERGEEKPVKQYDHCADALRYWARTIVKYVVGAR
jgi:PBSX family phage terminase large subunit